MTVVLPVIASRPADVIDLRRELVEFWERDGRLQRALAMQGRISIPGVVTSRATEGRAAREWFFETCRVAELYWVSPEMVDVLEAVASGMPDTIPSPPVPEALVVLAKPLPGLDAKTGITIHTAAYIWGPVIMATGERCLSVDTFGWRDFMAPTNVPEDEELNWRRTIPTHLVNTGGAEWPIQRMTSDVGSMQAPTDDAKASIIEDRRVMAAFWSLLSQRISVESLDHGDRPSRRRAERAGIQKLDPVRVIRLRESVRQTEDVGTEVEWSHRWIVGAHWRNQPYGPRSSLRRPQLISAHVKGPKDKPLVVRETVRALVR